MGAESAEGEFQGTETSLEFLDERGGEGAVRLSGSRTTGEEQSNTSPHFERSREEGRTIEEAPWEKEKPPRFLDGTRGGKLTFPRSTRDVGNRGRMFDYS